MAHGDPSNPKKNPHPVKRYEVIATADAPGPWDSVSGTVFFDIVNVDCVPQGSFTGGRNIPNASHEFEMARTGEKTWKGHFHRDLLLDEDYFGKGVCHWDATGMGPVFVAHGATFSPTRGLKQAMQAGSYTEYFKKSAYKDHSFTGMGALEFLPDSPEVARHPEDFFPITVTIKEIGP
ncbi:hypothetical protein [Rhodanobacter sp. DHB23]|uniref:hypothetical protein n=1 Tax=Rhodanobacter sp. DHB23 TaxID=2775923 RepID=UPI00177F0AA9|nr:hypothetical protein [Rhodanobacter sp. DHB23]MBD8873468.1 hypothetical protein [Rhodanobacter sp. DHB23]